jgi:hypothetical protein
MLERKPVQVYCWWDDGGVLARHFPVGGVILELQPCCTGVLWVKTLSGSWTSDDGAFGVVPSLEASSLESQLGWWYCRSIAHISFTRC